MQPTVLIVDDHPSFRSFARTMLEAEGFRVVGEAADAAGALAAVIELRPAIVLLDVQLPDLDGFEVARRSRRSSPSGSMMRIFRLSLWPALPALAIAVEWSSYDGSGLGLATADAVV